MGASCSGGKHYHSDNGVFTADMLKSDCKKEGQGQSFSGVGVQHQNTRAERVHTDDYVYGQEFYGAYKLALGQIWDRRPLTLAICSEAVRLDVHQDFQQAIWNNAIGTNYKHMEFVKTACMEMSNLCVESQASQ